MLIVVVVIVSVQHDHVTMASVKMSTLEAGAIEMLEPSPTRGSVVQSIRLPLEESRELRSVVVDVVVFAHLMMEWPLPRLLTDFGRGASAIVLHLSLSPFNG